MVTQEEKFIQMTQSPIGKTISRLAVPCIISMLVTAFYNMADTFFVGMLKRFLLWSGQRQLYFPGAGQKAV